jgi:hypothetical protein
MVIAEGYAFQMPPTQVLALSVKIDRFDENRRAVSTPLQNGGSSGLKFPTVHATTTTGMQKTCLPLHIYSKVPK